MISMKTKRKENIIFFIGITILVLSLVLPSIFKVLLNNKIFIVFTVIGLIFITYSVIKDMIVDIYGTKYFKYKGQLWPVKVIVRIYILSIVFFLLIAGLSIWYTSHYGTNSISDKIHRRK